MTSPLQHNPQNQHYWNANPRDTLFGALHNSLSSTFSGFSVCHPIYDEEAKIRALQHAIYSAIVNKEATATFVFLPVWGKHMITNLTPKFSLPIHIFAANLEPFYALTLVTTPLNPALVKKYYYLSTPGTYKILLFGTLQLESISTTITQIGYRA
eukprot:1141516-Pelagomonas_calceolata.AAC.2